MRFRGLPARQDPASHTCKDEMRREREADRDEFFNHGWTSWLPGSPLSAMVDVSSERRLILAGTSRAQGRTGMIGWFEEEGCARV